MPSGTTVKGIWNGRIYRLERLLGTGANGHVYLAANGRSQYAMKLGFEVTDLQGEANVLASLDHAERGRPPFLLDVDDFELNGRKVPFYVMRVVPGMPASAYLSKRGSEWLGVIGHRLLERLSQLHDAGWVFGDIKNENVLVHDYGKVGLVDYGGVTAIGRSVRQFTEIYDRGYWSAGSRTAEPSYDWFAAAMLWVHATDGKRLIRLTETLLPQNRHPRELLKLVRTNPHLRPVETWMERAFAGQFQDTADACLHWRSCLRQADRDALAASGGKVMGWMTGLFAASLVLFVSAAAVWLLFY
ncbi:serine/threonine protein kinase [Cohnella faecalis]|uniref:Serine/threonine protein kinase n=1 Tax=Cohnella faecalis TaxID=2315694 RepID=A0A398CGT4_9BACL|nr:serine/threonine protein kinase [Cohnella faecalis]